MTSLTPAEEPGGLHLHPRCTVKAAPQEALLGRKPDLAASRTRENGLPARVFYRTPSPQPSPCGPASVIMPCGGRWPCLMPTLGLALLKCCN